MSYVCKSIIITGSVQGVGFRFSANKMARSVGVKGYVRNLSDGSVQILAEGSQFQVDSLIKWCYQGSSYARVSNVVISDKAAQNYTSFSIKI